MGRHNKRTRKIHQWCRISEKIVLALGGTVTNPDNRNQLLQDWLGVYDKRWYTNLNGINAFFQTTEYTFSGDFEIEADISTTSANGTFVSGSADLLFRMAVISGVYWVFVGDGASWQRQVSSGVSVNDGAVRKLGFRLTGTLFELLVGGVVVASSTDADTVTPIISYIGRNYASSNFDGFIYNVKAWQGGDRNTGTLVLDAPLDEPYSESLIYENKASEDGEELIVNGDFSSGSTGWNTPSGVTFEDEFAKINVSSNTLLFQDFAWRANASYKVTLSLENITQTNFRPRVLFDGDSNGYTQFVPELSSGSGVFSVIVTPNNKNSDRVYLELGAFGLGAVYWINSISVKQTDDIQGYNIQEADVVQELP